MITRRELPLVSTLAAGWIFIYAGRTSLYPLLPVLQDEFGLSTTDVGVLLSVYWVLFVAAQFPAGALGDRIGPKRILLGSYAVGSLALLSLGTVVSSYIGVLVALVFFGIGTGAYFPTEYSVFVRSTSPGTRGMARGVINTGMSVGLGLGLVIVGPVYAWSGQWRTPLLLLAAPMIVLAVLFGRLLPIAKSRPSRMARLSIILRNRNFLKLYLASFCSLYGFWQLITWTPTLLQVERSVDIRLVGWIMAIVAITALPGGLLLGLISDYSGRRRISLLVLPLAAAAIWAVGRFGSTTAIVTALCVYGLCGKLAWQSVEHSWMGDLVALNNPELAGSFAGVWSLPVLFSSVLSSLLSGVSRDVTGSFSLAFNIAAGLVIVGWLIVMTMDDTVQKN